MRVRNLRFQGVGPYRDEQHIDFDALGRSALYLINGPTGAGKSTIIDCICFALYGRLAGDESDPARLRSDFAAPADPTQVDLLIDTASGTYRVIRTPRYLRAKARGSGDTEAKPTCKLFRVRPDGTEETIATTIAAADAELEAAIGLSRDQFVQTVVLPQGAFARFLYAQTTERQDILKRIFDTRLYERVAQILKQDADSARSARQDRTDQIRAEIRTLCTDAAVDDDRRDEFLRLATDRLDDDLRAALADLTPPLVEDVDRAAAAEHVTAAERQAADTTRERARVEAAARQRHETATQKVAAAASAVAGARTTVAAAADLAAELSISIDDGSVQAWRQRASAASSAVGRLDALIPIEQEILDWPAEQARRSTEIDEFRDQLVTDRHLREDLPRRIAIQEAIAANRPTLTEIEALSERSTALREAKEHLDDIDAARTTSQRLEADIVSELTAFDAARKRAAADARDYRDGIAADLALTLTVGGPCPVCGGLDHPNPAAAHGRRVRLEELEASRADEARASAHLNTVKADLDTARQTVQQLEASMPMTAAQYHAALDDASKVQADIERRARAADAADAELAGLRATERDVDGRLTAVELQMTKATAQLAERTQQIERHLEQVRHERGTAVTIADRCVDVRALAADLTSLADRLTEHAAAQEDLDSADQELRALPRHDRFADISSAESGWKVADAAHRAAALAHAGAKTRLADLTTRIDRIARACAERGRIVEESADLLDLADLVAVGRGNDFGLHIYVLRTLFDSVVEHANRRLDDLLDGRFTLVPAPDDSGDGRRTQGLGLWIEDHLTGRSRPAKSLSGGETFCASLALALGLSDVVRANAGGIQIGSLFVDEGFGSLDAEKLDDVLAMLSHLGSEDRLVGVISHVESMKSAIPERIDVTHAGQGSPATLSATWMS